MLTRLLDRLRFIRDKRYVSRIYREQYHRDLNWEHPTRFTEKINIFKISSEIKKLSSFTDKYEVREYVKKLIGDEYLIPLLAVYDRVEEINLEELPNKFVFKCTHGSGMNIICTDKTKFDWPKAQRQLRIWLKSNFYYTFGRELQYNFIKPRIICEQYQENDDNNLIDYKIYCFRGIPEFIRVMSGRSTQIKKTTYDPFWKPTSFQFISESTDKEWVVPKPNNLDKMLDIAAVLSKEFPFVRVDLYNIGGRIYFGELTFTPAAGIQFFDPESYDELYGSKF